jgi:hypothetical protein
MYTGGNYKRPDDAEPDVTWEQVASLYPTSFDDIDEEAAWAAAQVGAVTGNDPLVVDLTWGVHARPEFHVVKVAAPRLRFSGRQHVGRPGQESWE